MSSIVRGVKNTLRNTPRTIGFATVIAVSLGLAFSMLLANRAVHEREQQLRNDIGASLIVQTMQSTQDPGAAPGLSDSDANKIARLPHVHQVIKVDTTVVQHPDEIKQNKKIQKENSSISDQGNQFTLSGGGPEKDPPTTNLVSAIDMNELKKHTFGKFQPTIPPIVVEGTTGNVDGQGTVISLKEGHKLQKNDADKVLIGEALAKKNHLKIHDTVTLNGKSYKIVGIFTSGTPQGDNRIITSLTAVRTISGTTKDTVPTIVVEADTLENLDAVKQATSAKLGNGVMVRILQPEAVKLAGSLRSIKTISLATLVVALVAGTLTILLTMLLVVRERTKEIGTLKALGATNAKIVSQFITESTTLTLIGAGLGMCFAAATSNMILKALISGNVPKPAEPSSGGAIAIAGNSSQSVNDAVRQITALVDWHLIVYGLAIALGIALVAAAVPAFLIAKVRPAQIMRGDS